METLTTSSLKGSSTSKYFLETSQSVEVQWHTRNLINF